MDVSRARFEEEGYVVIKGLLSPEECSRYRAEIQKMSGLNDDDYAAKSFECPDGMTQNRPFWPLIYDERLVEAVRELVGPTARYTQHSDVHAHRGSAAASPKHLGGWHRDSACRDYNIGPDWDESVEPYRIVRVAIYLQSYAESRSALGVVPGSHRHEEKLSPNTAKLWKRLLDAEYKFKQTLARAGLAEEPHYYHPWFHHRTKPAAFPLLSRPTDPIWVKTEPGDCLIFHQRLYHSASAIKGPKYALFLSYSAENEHARNHLRYYRYLRKDLKYKPIDPELAHILMEHGLFMDVPDPQEIAGASVTSDGRAG
jgi:hypothetical protein